MFTKKIEIVGVGYSVQLVQSELIFQIGRSHPDIKKVPEGIKVTCEKQSLIIEGEHKLQVHTFADEIRRLRKPERYKGKGIRYTDENVILKKMKKK
jgi:large subunit ribosomal protein L6